jgi:hypothetical protein
MNAHVADLKKPKPQNVKLIDKKRIEKSMASGSIDMPQGLTRDQMKQFILNHA